MNKQHNRKLRYCAGMREDGRQKEMKYKTILNKNMIYSL